MNELKELILKIRLRLSSQDPARAAWEDSAASQNKSSASRLRLPRRSRLRLKETSWLISQLATTQAAGIPLYRALGMIAKMRKGTLIGTKSQALQDATSEGATLSQAIASHMPEAGSLISALVSAGEASGALEEALKRAVELTEGRQRLVRKVRSALTYPVMVVLVCALLVIGLLTVVVPRFKEIYASVGSELPAMTQIVVAIADKIPFILVGLGALVAGAAFGWVKSRNNMKVRLYLDTFKLRIPILGPLMRKAAIARVASTLATLVGSGVSLLDALTLAARTSGSIPFANALDRTRERIGEGSTLAGALAESGEFPELMVQLVSVGEESGSLAKVLERYAVQASEELESSTEAVTSLIEPLLMVFVGVIVAVFVVALYLPVIQLGQKVGG